LKRGLLEKEDKPEPPPEPASESKSEPLPQDKPTSKPRRRKEPVVYHNSRMASGVRNWLISRRGYGKTITDAYGRVIARILRNLADRYEAGQLVCAPDVLMDCIHGLPHPK
jgi:hypothetical protein